MISIDNEFTNLMEEVLGKISSKKNSGEYLSHEADELTRMVIDCMHHIDLSNYGNSCPEGHSDPENCGWSPSMGYHCS